MRKNYRLLTLPAVLLLAMLAFAGCGEQANTEPPRQRRFFLDRKSVV